MSLRRLSGGRYEARYYRDGTKAGAYVRENFGRISLDEARELYRKRLAEASGRKVRGAHLLMFRAAAAQYLAVRSGKMTARGAQRARSIIDLHLLPAFAERRIATITAGEVEAWMAGRVKAGGSKATANREWNVLRAVLMFAKKKLRSDCPALGEVEAFRLADGGARRVFLEPEEWRRLRTAFDDEGRFRALIKDRRRMRGMRHDSAAADEYLARLRAFAPVFDLLLYTGARLGEVIALRWRDVDFERGRITLRQTKAGGRPIILPIAGPLAVTLKAIPRGVGDAPILRLPDGTAIDRECVRRTFAVARDLAGLRPAITPHALRHTLGSWLAMEGVSLRTIQEILGHSSPAVTAKHYAHLAPAGLEVAIGTIGKVAGRVASGARGRVRRGYSR